MTPSRVGWGEKCCKACVHCVMWVQRRRVAYCTKDGTEPEDLAIVPDSSAGHCEEFTVSEASESAVEDR